MSQHYGSLDYCSLGRVAPRDRLREPFRQTSRRALRWLSGGAPAPAPRPRTIVLAASRSSPASLSASRSSPIVLAASRSSPVLLAASLTES